MIHIDEIENKLVIELFSSLFRLMIYLTLHDIAIENPYI